MTIALYSHTSRLGGAEIALPSLAQQLGADVWVSGDGPLLDHARRHGIQPVALRRRVDTRARGLFGALSALGSVMGANWTVWRTLVRNRPEILVSNTLQGALHAALPCALLGTPVVVYVRDLGRGGNRSAHEVRLYRFLLRRARGAIFNSRLTRDSWDVGGHTRVVPTAVADAYRTVSWKGDGGRTAVMVGRIAAWKGQQRVIDAMRIVAQSLPDVALVLVGDTQFEDSVDLAVEGVTVDVTGFVSDPEQYLKSADVVIHASQTPEPFGQVLAQAASVGAPIVCADRGGHTEWLEHEKTCLMIDPLDPADIAQAIINVLTNPTDARKRAERARHRALEFTPERAYAGLRDWLMGLARPGELHEAQQT